MKHDKHPRDFEIIPRNYCLHRTGPQNQFFSLKQLQQQPPNQVAQQQPDPEQENPEPVADGVPHESPPVLAHGWVWDAFLDQMATDWRGAAPKNDAHMCIGGLNPSDMSASQFFDAFFPWDYVRDHIIPATNEVLKENGDRDTSVNEFKLYLGLWIIISLNPGYVVRDFWVVDPPRPQDFLWNPPYLEGSMSRT